MLKLMIPFHLAFWKEKELKLIYLSLSHISNQHQNEFDLDTSTRINAKRVMLLFI